MKLKEINKRRKDNYIWLKDVRAGSDTISVFGELGYGGGRFVINDSKYIHPKDCGNRVLVGLDHHSWKSCLDIMNHEFLEYFASRLHLRYVKEDWWCRTSAGFIFMMNHEEWSEMIQLGSEAMAQVLGSMHELYDSCHKLKLN